MSVALRCPVGSLEGREEGAHEGETALEGTLSSVNCALTLALNGTTTHMEEQFAKAINYTLMITAVSFLQASCPSLVPCVLRKVSRRDEPPPGFLANNAPRVQCAERGTQLPCHIVSIGGNEGECS
jgi:hypothetical protein